MGAIPWWRKFATNNATCVTDQGSMHLACIVSLIKVSKAVIAFAYIFFFRRCIQQDVKTRQNSTGSKLGGTAVGCGLLLGLNALNFSTCWRGRQSAKVLSYPMTNCISRSFWIDNGNQPLNICMKYYAMVLPKVSPYMDCKDYWVKLQKS